jgi:hypothetical protein
MPAAPPPLTVVVPTTHAWPSLKPCLDVLLPQCNALGAELLIPDATGQGLPSGLCTSGAQLRTIHVPGASVFELRARATAEARGSIVAWTEDHCIPAPDWCRHVLDAHERHPEAAAIGGAVLNGSCGCVADWANFLCTFSPFLPPITRSTTRMPAVANVSFRRDALPEGPIRPDWIETRLLAELSAAGRLRFDDGPQVTHVQSWGFRRTFAAHFHNGRSTGGLLADALEPAVRRSRIARSYRTPYEVAFTAVRPLIGRPSIPWLRCLPMICGLAFAFTAGELAGLMTRSAGRSPHLLE